VIRLIVLLLATIVGTLVGGLIGVFIGGNWAASFEFAGRRGYEGTVWIGAAMGAALSATLALLVGRARASRRRTHNLSSTSRER
jgi:hypothetical protein